MDHFNLLRFLLRLLLTSDFAPKLPFSSSLCCTTSGPARLERVSLCLCLCVCLRMYTEVESERPCRRSLSPPPLAHSLPPALSLYVYRERQRAIHRAAAAGRVSRRGEAPMR